MQRLCEFSFRHFATNISMADHEKLFDFDSPFDVNLLESIVVAASSPKGQSVEMVRFALRVFVTHAQTHAPYFLFPPSSFFPVGLHFLTLFCIIFTLSSSIWRITSLPDSEKTQGPGFKSLPFWRTLNTIKPNDSLLPSWKVSLTIVGIPCRWSSRSTFVNTSFLT